MTETLVVVDDPGLVLEDLSTLPMKVVMDRVCFAPLRVGSSTTLYAAVSSWLNRWIRSQILPRFRCSQYLR